MLIQFMGTGHLPTAINPYDVLEVKQTGIGCYVVHSRGGMPHTSQLVEPFKEVFDLVNKHQAELEVRIIYRILSGEVLTGMEHRIRTSLLAKLAEVAEDASEKRFQKLLAELETGDAKEPAPVNKAPAKGSKAAK